MDKLAQKCLRNNFAAEYAQRGSRRPDRQKLSDETIREIAESTEIISFIARKYNISRSYAWKLRAGHGRAAR